MWPQKWDKSMDFMEKKRFSHIFNVFISIFEATKNTSFFYYTSFF